MENLPNINFLRYFFSAAKHKSMSKAAEENFVTQSAISQGISKLEIELGKQLITASKNRFQMTLEGELLMEKCENIFSMFSEIKDLFHEKEGVFKGKLILATTYSFAISVLPKFYEKLFKCYPDVKPILRLGHTGLIREFVSKNEVDLGVVLVHEDLPEYNSKLITQGIHRLYSAKKKSKPIISRLIISENKREDHLLIEYLSKTLTSFPPIIEVLSWEAIARMVKQGFGVGFLPDYVAEAHGLAPFPIDIPDIIYRIIAIYSKNRSLTRNANMFINLMTE